MPEQVLDRASFMAEIVYNEQGLVPAVVQDAASGQFLMMAWMNRTSLEQSLDLGETVFWSRSRQAYWHKGATSGNTQRIVDVRVDCDGDVLLFRVVPAGPACHTGEVSCFFRALDPSAFCADEDAAT